MLVFQSKESYEHNLQTIEDSEIKENGEINLPSLAKFSFLYILTNVKQTLADE